MRVAVVRATNMAEDAQFSYAINAARRSEKRRVHNFVRLLDYMVCNALHVLLRDGWKAAPMQFLGFRCLHLIDRGSAPLHFKCSACSNCISGGAGCSEQISILPDFGSQWNTVAYSQCIKKFYGVTIFDDAPAAAVHYV
eukprot:1147994-Pelagomonas_calceolata.AAC.1